MSRTGKPFIAAPLVLCLALWAAAAAPARADAVVVDLSSDPFAPGSAASLELQGPGNGSFLWDATAARSFPSDASGSLLVAFDSTNPTERAVARLGSVVTEADDFVFGAILSIRAAGFEADPFGFHPITFSLLNTATTGFDRTGSLSDFRSDTFDSIDVAYFPQESPIFGGPFLSPDVYGSRLSDDAFADFTFGSIPFRLTPGVTYLLLAEYDAATRSLTVTAHTLGEGGLPVPAPGGRVTVDLSSLSGFAVDALAVTAYEDGFNVFTSTGRSVRADIDYDALFFAPGRLGEPGSLPSLESLVRRASQGAQGLASH